MELKVSFDRCRNIGDIPAETQNRWSIPDPWGFLRDRYHSLDIIFGLAFRGVRRLWWFVVKYSSHSNVPSVVRLKIGSQGTDFLRVRRLRRVYSAHQLETHLDLCSRRIDRAITYQLCTSIWSWRGHTSYSETSRGRGLVCRSIFESIDFVPGIHSKVGLGHILYVCTQTRTLGLYYATHPFHSSNWSKFI